MCVHQDRCGGGVCVCVYTRTDGVGENVWWETDVVGECMCVYTRTDGVGECVSVCVHQDRWGVGECVHQNR